MMARWLTILTTQILAQVTVKTTRTFIKYHESVSCGLWNLCSEKANLLVSFRLRALCNICTEGYQKGGGGTCAYFAIVVVNSWFPLTLDFQLREDYATYEYPEWFLALCKDFGLDFSYVKM